MVNLWSPFLRVLPIDLKTRYATNWLAGGVLLLIVSVPFVWWKSNEAGNPRIWNEAFWFTEAFHLMRCKEPSSVATIISSRTHKQLIIKEKTIWHWSLLVSHVKFFIIHTGMRGYQYTSVNGFALPMSLFNQISRICMAIIARISVSYQVMLAGSCILATRVTLMAGILSLSGIPLMSRLGVWFLSKPNKS